MGVILMLKNKDSKHIINFNVHLISEAINQCSESACLLRAIHAHTHALLLQQAKVDLY